MGTWENRGWEGYGRRGRKRRVFMLVLLKRAGSGRNRGNYATMLNILQPKNS